jgi:hypothetical protein
MIERRAPQPLFDLKRPSLEMLDEFERWFITTGRGTREQASECLYRAWEKQWR